MTNCTVLARFALGVLPLLIYFSNVAAADEGTDIGGLITQLGSSVFDERQEATRQLIDLGDPARRSLLVAAEGSTDAEVRYRAKIVLALIEKQLFREICRFTGHADIVWAVAFLPDGRHIFTAGGGDLQWPVGAGSRLRGADVGHTERLFLVVGQIDDRTALRAALQPQQFFAPMHMPDASRSIATAPEGARSVISQNCALLADDGYFLQADVWPVCIGR
jgi:hypothetical protein